MGAAGNPSSRSVKTILLALFNAFEAALSGLLAYPLAGNSNYSVPKVGVISVGLASNCIGGKCLVFNQTGITVSCPESQFNPMYGHLESTLPSSPTRISSDLPIASLWEDVVS
ncbi:hypothetical protein CEXT_778111 [Caerostris extrusa]|uniref:Uncharacterized protein n=1 Tax=Caerostris extrusa TaxID=172846 RepID=A0AAV4R5H0_CAEEX|nr:hypothetical protein CEXT_778111 [Caerostris extrusa]